MRFRAMGKDSLNSSHPITNQVATAEQVEEMFDSVSYEKVMLGLGLGLYIYEKVMLGLGLYI